VPFSRRLARFNRVVTNRIARPLAAVLPGFAVVEHSGRRSGRAYRTPVNAFRHGDGFVIVLTYGAASDWVANVRAAGGCTLVRLGRRHALGRPELVAGAPAEALFPRPLRWFLRAMHVDEALLLSATMPARP
jgi:deazaflavin-dependent oxidoreductase (nitroreductase family)